MALNFSSPTTSFATTQLTTSATIRSISVLVNRAGAGGGSLARILSKWTTNVNNEEWLWYWDNGSSEFRFQVGRATTNDSVRIIGSGLLNTWMQLGVQYDTTTSSVTGVTCFNGTVTSWASANSVTGSGAYTPNSDPVLIGNRSDLIRNLNGSVAEIGIWDRALDTQEWAMLGKFVSPRRIPRGRTFFASLSGNNPRCLHTGTITLSGGTVSAHPPVRG